MSGDELPTAENEGTSNRSDCHELSNERSIPILVEACPTSSASGDILVAALTGHDFSSQEDHTSSEDALRGDVATDLQHQLLVRQMIGERNRSKEDEHILREIDPTELFTNPLLSAPWLARAGAPMETSSYADESAVESERTAMEDAQDILDKLLSPTAGEQLLCKSKWTHIYESRFVEDIYLLKHSKRTVDVTLLSLLLGIAMIGSASSVGIGWVFYFDVIIAAGILIPGMVNGVAWIRYWKPKTWSAGVARARIHEYCGQAILLVYALSAFAELHMNTACAEFSLGHRDTPSRYKYCVKDSVASPLLQKLLPLFLVDVRPPVAVPSVVASTLFLVVGLAPVSPSDRPPNLEFALMCVIHIIVTVVVCAALIALSHHRHRQFEEWVRLERSTRALVRRRQRIDAILAAVLPQGVLTQLTSGFAAFDASNNCAIAVCRIHDFVRWSTASLPPADVVQVIDALHTVFQNTLEGNKFQAKKVKAIGDRFFVAQGFDGDLKLLSLLKFCDHQVKLASKLKKLVVLELCCGVDCGPCVGGVIGENSLSYEIAGEVCGIAMRLADTCDAGRIKVSDTVRAYCMNYAVGFDKAGVLEAPELKPKENSITEEIYCFFVVQSSLDSEKNVAKAASEQMEMVKSSTGLSAASSSCNSITSVSRLASQRYQFIRSKVSAEGCRVSERGAIHAKNRLKAFFDASIQHQSSCTAPWVLDAYLDTARALSCSLPQHFATLHRVAGYSYSAQLHLILVGLLFIVPSIEGAMTIASACLLVADMLFIFLHIVVQVRSIRELTAIINSADAAGPSAETGSVKASLRRQQLLLMLLMYALPLLATAFMKPSIVNQRPIFLVYCLTALLMRHFSEASWVWSGLIEVLILALAIYFIVVIREDVLVNAISVLLFGAYAIFYLRELEHRRRGYYVTLVAADIVREAAFSENAMQQGLLHMLLPPPVIPQLERKLESRGGTIVTFADTCVAHIRIDLLNGLMAQAKVGLDVDSPEVPAKAFRSAESIFGSLEACLRSSQGVVQRVHAVGDQVLLAAPLAHSKRTDPTRAAVELPEAERDVEEHSALAAPQRKSAGDDDFHLHCALTLLRVVDSIHTAFPHKVTSVMHTDVAMTSIIGTSRPTVSLTGPAPHTAEAIFAAASKGTRVITSNYVQLLTAANVRSLAVGSPQRWRVRGIGQVTVHVIVDDAQDAT